MRYETEDGYEEEGAAPPPSARLSVKAILLVAAIVAVSAGSFLANRIADKEVSPANVPVIRADSRPIKEPPKDPGGMVVPDQDSLLLNRGESAIDGKVEQLLPAPETPLPRPVARPALPVVAPAAQSIVTVPALASALVATANAATRPQARKAYRLQLSSVRSQEAAQPEWERLRRIDPAVLGKLTLTTARTDLGGGKGVYYRILAGPIADAAAAERACRALKQRNLGCILVKP